MNRSCVTCSLEAPAFLCGSCGTASYCSNACGKAHFEHCGIRYELEHENYNGLRSDVRKERKQREDVINNEDIALQIANRDGNYALPLTKVYGPSCVLIATIPGRATCYVFGEFHKYTVDQFAKHLDPLDMWTYYKLDNVYGRDNNPTGSDFSTWSIERLTFAMMSVAILQGRPLNFYLETVPDKLDQPYNDDVREFVLAEPKRHYHISRLRRMLEPLFYANTDNLYRPRAYATDYRISDHGSGVENTSIFCPISFLYALVLQRCEAKNDPNYANVIRSEIIELYFPSIRTEGYIQQLFHWTFFELASQGFDSCVKHIFSTFASRRNVDITPIEKKLLQPRINSKFTFHNMSFQARAVDRPTRGDNPLRGALQISINEALDNQRLAEEAVAFLNAGENEHLQREPFLRLLEEIQLWCVDVPTCAMMLSKQKANELSLGYFGAYHVQHMATICNKLKGLAILIPGNVNTVQLPEKDRLFLLRYATEPILE